MLLPPACRDPLHIECLSFGFGLSGILSASLPVLNTSVCFLCRHSTSWQQKSGSTKTEQSMSARMGDLVAQIGRLAAALRTLNDCKHGMVTC